MTQEISKPQFVCIVCGENFIVHNYRKDTAKCCSKECYYKSRKGKKCSEETKLKMSKTAKDRGTGLWMKGKKMSLETIKKKRDTAIRLGIKPPNLKGIKRSDEFKEKLRIANLGNKHCLGRKMSLSSKIKIGEAHKGEKCYFWKGGISAENYRERQIAYSTLKYQEWRRCVLKKGNYKCLNCGDKKNLNAHHVLSWLKHKDLRYDVNNGIVLCKSCHIKLHSYEKRK